VTCYQSPIFIRPLSDDEQRQHKAGLHSSDAFVFRRCQILLASEPYLVIPEQVA
jgi:hypothetical protein